jgi:hypothetical protein
MTCGECKHREEGKWKCMPCLAPIPLWAEDALIEEDLNTNVDKDRDATDCPCFERKEEK